MRALKKVSPALSYAELNYICFKVSQIIILPGVQNYEPARRVHVPRGRPCAWNKYNMVRMNSPYLTGLSSESPIESLVAAHKIAPFEVQGVKLKNFFFVVAHCFQTNNWAVDQ
jgi:hypothetical protein